jgi:hypothetical protein
MLLEVVKNRLRTQPKRRFRPRKSPAPNVEEMEFSPAPAVEVVVG